MFRWISRHDVMTVVSYLVVLLVDDPVGLWVWILGLYESWSTFWRSVLHEPNRQVRHGIIFPWFWGFEMSSSLFDKLCLQLVCHLWDWVDCLLFCWRTVLPGLEADRWWAYRGAWWCHGWCTVSSVTYSQSVLCLNGSLNTSNWPMVVWAWCLMRNLYVPTEMSELGGFEAWPVVRIYLFYQSELPEVVVQLLHDVICWFTFDRVVLNVSRAEINRDKCCLTSKVHEVNS